MDLAKKLQQTPLYKVKLKDHIFIPREWKREEEEMS